MPENWTHFPPESVAHWLAESLAHFSPESVAHLDRNTHLPVELAIAAVQMVLTSL
jgi:hypothetical protein